MCVLCAAEYGQNSLDITWHLIGSISVRNACSCMCADLVGGNSLSLPCGFSRTGGSGRIEYDSTDVFKVNRHGLDVVHRMETLQIQLADA